MPQMRNWTLWRAAPYRRPHSGLSLPSEPCGGRDLGYAVLCNFEHLAEISPYRASHAIYVRQGAVQATPAVDEVPMVLTRRMLSIRGFGYDHLLKEAEVIDGATLAATLGVFSAMWLFHTFISTTRSLGVLRQKRRAADAS